MRKRIILNKGMFLATTILGIVAFSCCLMSDFISISSIMSDYYSSINGFNWIRFAISVISDISLIVLSILTLTKTKNKEEGGRAISGLFGLFTTIGCLAGVFVYGFTLIELATFNTLYVINLGLNMVFSILGIIDLVYLDKEGKINKVLNLVCAFSLAFFKLFNISQDITMNIFNFASLPLLAFEILTIISLFMMKDSKEVESNQQ